MFVIFFLTTFMYYLFNLLVDVLIKKSIWHHGSIIDCRNSVCVPFHLGVKLWKILLLFTVNIFFLLILGIILVYMLQHKLCQEGDCERACQTLNPWVSRAPTIPSNNLSIHLIVKVIIFSIVRKILANLRVVSTEKCNAKQK